MTWMHKMIRPCLRTVLPGLFAIALTTAPLPAAADEDDAIARLAMSTASILMMGEHEHEIEEALEKGDFEEAHEEAAELVPWLKGTPWRAELTKPAGMALAATEALVATLAARDAEASRAAFEKLEKSFHHLHHELMELVGGSMHH